MIEPLPILNRLVEFDERSRAFPIRTMLPQKPPRSYTWRCFDYFDQKSEGACTGFGWTHELAARPSEVTGLSEETARAIYHRAKQLDPWEGECVSMETTCLSKKGWVNGDQLQVGDEIMVFDIVSETTKWAPVQKVHIHENATYRKWSHKGFQAEVTDNHRWAVRTRPSGKNHPNHYKMVITVDWTSGHEIPRSAPHHAYPQKPIYSDDFVELVAWVTSEGYYRPDSRRGTGIVICQKIYMGRLKELMERLSVADGHLKTDGSHSWELSGLLSRQVREAAPERAPSINFLLSLTQEQLGLFINVFLLGDGNISLVKGRQERRTFSQKTGPILDAILFAMVLADIPVSRSGVNKGSLNNVEQWHLRKSRNIETRHLVAGDYQTGRVWCPQTEYGTFVARYGPSIFITGNSYEGTSVLAAIKALQELHPEKIMEYRWAFGINDVIMTLSYKGPVVLGINWYQGMMNPDNNGIITPTGWLGGGHCILAVGYNHKTGFIRLHNSWGKDWGKGGDCFIHRDDLNKLLYEQGEACVAVKRAPEKRRI